ncbi:hypothetical protein Taro_050775 [Colocasia esculenta]|uniref:Uncharacterized protein n=1 Tax=Colocasia esculenta TaxID=4460 RepID=A0A843XEP0_COLES|nr:hypothetical protein [Colocasia esculenta]
MTTLDLRKVKGPHAEPTCTSDTPQGQGTTPTGAPRTAPRNGVRDSSMPVALNAPSKAHRDGVSGKR